MTPFISVVMPTYNSEKHIAEAIESILRQTVGDFEFLIVNEYGSADSTLDIVAAFNDSRIRVIQSVHKLGVAASLNEGMRQARGKYIARMDSDDISLTDRFEKQAGFLENNPDISVCGGWVQVFGQSNYVYKAQAAHEDIQASLLFSCDMCHSVVMLRRADMAANDLWYDPAYLAEDYELWIRAIRRVKFTNLQEVLGCYRDSETNRTSKKFKTIIAQEQDLYDRTLKEFGINYKKDYPPFLIGGWVGSLDNIQSGQWKERLKLLRDLFSLVAERNKKMGVLDGAALSRSLYRKYMQSLIIGDTRVNSGVQPFVYLADDIINDLETKIGERLCLFGMGEIGSALLPHFKRRFGGRIVCVSDNDPQKWGKRFEGLECIPPDGMPRDLCIVITAGYEGNVEISVVLASKGFARVLPFVAPIVP